MVGGKAFLMGKALGKKHNFKRNQLKTLLAIPTKFKWTIYISFLGRLKMLQVSEEIKWAWGETDNRLFF